MENIQEFEQIVESHIESEGSNIFDYTTANYSEFISEIEWDDVENWQKFFLIAKNEGILTFYKQTQQFSQDEFDTITENLDEDKDEYPDLIENICENLESNLDEIYSINFSWFKNNIRHIITRKVSWVIEMEKDLAKLDQKKSLNKVNEIKDKKNRRKTHEDIQDEQEEQREMDIPENLIGEEEKLAQELLEFWQKENPAQSRYIDWSILQAFWELHQLYRFNPKHQLFQNRVKDLAMQLCEKNEKEKIPDLLEKCIEWGVENKRSKTTQSEIREFLEDMGEDLSLNNIKSILEKTNRQLEVKEKEQIPNFIEQCVEWAVENKMFKPTQTGIKGFLAENDISLTPINFKILYSKVTMELNSIK